ncbi:MAG TPA: hypothetical protein VFU21_06765 [Kofleriaceae bacterium]|nr:hypothetical protein [Kofleriaceae bacterium]
MTAAARLALVAALAGCADRTLSTVPPRPSGEQRQEIPTSTNRDIDILFVVDDSDSMAQEQGSLARNFPEFVRVLESIGDLPDVHLGVVSSNVGTAPYEVGDCEGQGDDGLLQVPPACPPLTDGRRYIESVADPDAPGGRRVNFTTATMAEQFACMAELGDDGCGFEQHFESMRRALDGRNGDFLRDDAFLAVIFIQDEDDCSASDRAVFGSDPDLGPLSSFRCFEYGVRCEPDDPRATGPRQDCAPRDDSRYIEEVQTYVDFLRSRKADPARVIVAGIAGAAAPIWVEVDPTRPTGELWTRPVCTVCPGGGDSCAAPLVSARPSVRLHALLDAFPQKSTFQDICAYDPDIDDVDLSGALVQIAALLRRALGTPCIAGPLFDGDPAQDGVQPVCSVSDFIHLRQPDQRENLLVACEGPLTCDADVPDPPCYRFESNPECGTETDLTIVIDRCEPAPRDTTVVVRCALE